MELKSQETKNKQKNPLTKFLLPHRIPNKVGAIVGRSNSVRDTAATSTVPLDNRTASNISNRPLSLDIPNSSNFKTILPKSGELSRRSSLSENNVFSGNKIPDIPEHIIEKSTSHESILKESHVLQSVPTIKARQRNYLCGKIGVNPLLGSLELNRLFPKRQVNIFVGTWNMNGHAPPKELNDFVLPVGVEHVPEILAFGTQESYTERFEWEVCLQETIGPSHLLYHSVSLGTLHLAIFLHRDLIWYISLAEDATFSVRPGTAFRTKGAVACSFMLFGTSFLFVTAHLTAHQEKVRERVSDVKRIVNSLDLPKTLPCKHKTKDVTQNFDYIFWSGDLNFRLATPRDKVLEWLSNTEFPLPEHLPHGYLHHDQLCLVLSEGAAFKGFSEAKITFPPTYKYDPGTQNFDTSSKQRTPAYTDRILYKHRTSRRLSIQPDVPPLQCVIYDSVPSITTSDHKPVWGVFKACLKPGFDTIPLAAGLFNRDVYVEGLRRRATALNFGRGASTVCCIQ